MGTTELVIFSLLLAAALYDAYVVFTKGVGSSISRAMEKLGLKSQLAVFTVGCVIGHFWFGLEPECPKCPSQPVHCDETLVPESARE